MKNKSIITILSLCLGLSMATTSCDDMLSSDSDRHSYEVAGDTLYSYWGILKSLQNIGERYVILGECRGDLIDGGEFTTDSVNAILSFGLNGDTENIKDGANRYLKVSDYYHVINSCNAYLAKVDTLMEKADGEKYMLREYAQVEAIRAWTYMQLVVNYGDVPFYLEPMLSTEQILGFDSKDPENRVNASNLWEKLENKLMRAYQIEEQWGYPQYNNYGYTTAVCHSSKAMFPVSLVLADIYLMGNKYPEAAAYYYEFLDGKYGGALPMNYYSYGWLPQGENTPIVNNIGYPWIETGAVSKNTESITAIPSSTNSLWGIVQRGVNDLYGFDATIRQSTGSDSIARASIQLSLNWERQLGPSAGYDTLRLAQKFECYVISDLANIDDESKTQLVVLDSVGDARGLTNSFGDGYICNFNSGDYYIDDVKTERYIMKQNPNAAYSTVFPMVYRKSMVWLRFAEALNRAGYPGYAFAILKNGMTRNSEWLPSDENDFAVKTARVHYEYNGTYTDAEGNQKDTILILPANWEENDLCVITGPDYDSVAYNNDLDSLVAAIMAEAPEHFDTIPAEELTAHFTANIKKEVVEYANFQPSATSIVCDYISRNEWEKAKGLIWLDFNKGQFDGIQDADVNYVRDFPLLQNTYMFLTEYPTTMPVNEYVTRGIHQKGCGLLKYNEKRSVYNYVDQINLKLRSIGVLQPADEDWTKAEIYDPANQTVVIEAIEELILDEAGLELAFEGNRFFDLMRVANRKANPAKFMAEKIKARGTSTEAWVNALESDIKNWYLPLPDYSYRK